MLFYNFKLACELRRNSDLREAHSVSRDRWYNRLEEMNEVLYEEVRDNKIAMTIYRATLKEFCLVAAINELAVTTSDKLAEMFKGCFAKKYGLSSVNAGTLKEITPAQAKKLLEIGSRYAPCHYRGGEENFELDYYDNRQFKIEEQLIQGSSISYQKAVAEANKMMADATLLEELERIYDKKHPRVFKGHPVHYKISAGESGSARQIANLLAKAMYANQRLVGRSISRIHEIEEQCYDEHDLETIFRQSAGGTIIIELTGSRIEHQNYASCYEEVVAFLSGLIRKHQRDTLFILVETAKNPGFAPSLISDLQEDIYLIEIKEGTGNRSVALKYLQALLGQAGLDDYDEQELMEALGDKTIFRASDIHNIYDKLYRDNLRNKSYVAYKQVSRLMVPRNDMAGKDAYKILTEMIGLKKVKEMVEQILATFRMQKIRSSMGLEQQKMSLHMIFTGNPGSAKTTVARLLAEILSKEGILETGEFVECGRADLVGKYVGWTAPAVKRQFKLAKGGVLFIDEAYSLVDDRDGCYGDEAINTIVQEMENHRDDTIVIFAGYPDKMKKFLDKNEGLRSRIAFHVDFPDYNADELLGILKLMADKKGFALSSAVSDKCRQIFAAACRQEEFGNGRFVRNLLEQALLKQSRRIMAESEGKEISREEILCLKPDDFAVNAAEQYGKSRKSLGFAI